MAKCLRARVQIADNFESNSLIWGIFSLLAPFFRVFHSHLSDSDSLAPREADRLIRLGFIMSDRPPFFLSE
jgi:hypothetical protein